MSHPGLEIDPGAAAAEFAAVAQVLDIPVGEVVGGGADPATAAAAVALGAACLDDTAKTALTVGDQAAAGSAGQSTVTGYVATEGQNTEALSRPETIEV